MPRFPYLSSLSWFRSGLFYVTFVIRAILVCATMRILWAIGTLQAIASRLLTIRTWKNQKYTVVLQTCLLIFLLLFLRLFSAVAFICGRFLCHDISKWPNLIASNCCKIILSWSISNLSRPAFQGGFNAHSKEVWNKIHPKIEPVAHRNLTKRSEIIHRSADHCSYMQSIRALTISLGPPP